MVLAKQCDGTRDTDIYKWNTSSLDTYVKYDTHYGLMNHVIIKKNIVLIR